MELELEELVNNIFNRQPQPSKSIQLQFIENLSTREIFEFLLSFFTEGAKYKFGEDKTDPNTKVDISKWTTKELDLMKEYFASISFKLNVNIVNILNKNNKKIKSYKDNDINESTPLKNLPFPIFIGNFVYIISFDYLFNHLKTEGIYLIEDTHTSYHSDFQDRQDGLTFMDYAKSLSDKLNLWYQYNDYKIYKKEVKEKINMPYFTKNAFKIIFYNSVVVIQKKHIKIPRSQIK